MTAEECKQLLDIVGVGCEVKRDNENNDVKESNEMELIKTIDTNRNITESKSLSRIAKTKINKKQYDLILYLISLIDKNDEDFKIYKIPFSTLLQLYKSSNPRKNDTKRLVIEAVETLMEAYFYFIDEESNKLYYYHWIESVTIAGDDQMMYFKISPDIKPFYLKLQEGNTTTYRLKNVLNLRTLTESNLYIWAYHNKGFKNAIPISIEDAKSIFCGNRKIRTADFFRQNLEPAIKRINENTDLYITYEKVYKDSTKSNKISSLKFNIYDLYKEGF